MGLSKQITDNKGQVTNYHRILVQAQSFVPGQECVDINLAGYTSKDYRDLEKADGQERVVTNIGIKLPLADEDFSRAKLYERIRTECEEFKDAEDV